jgi:hypothetical protein
VALTLFDSLDPIRNFADDQEERPVIEPSAAEVLADTTTGRAILRWSRPPTTKHQQQAEARHVAHLCAKPQEPAAPAGTRPGCGHGSRHAVRG